MTGVLTAAPVNKLAARQTHIDTVQSETEAAERGPDDGHFSQNGICPLLPHHHTHSQSQAPAPCPIHHCIRLHLLPRAFSQHHQHMTMAMATPAPKRVSKACDACKLRKVKCNGQERCQQCSHLGLRCVYSVSVRTRSQGKRGRIISEYKNKTSNATTISTSILPVGEQSPVQASPLDGIPYSFDQRECEHPLISIKILH